MGVSIQVVNMSISEAYRLDQLLQEYKSVMKYLSTTRDVLIQCGDEFGITSINHVMGDLGMEIANLQKIVDAISKHLKEADEQYSSETDSCSDSE